MKDLLNQSVQKILHSIEEGVHIIGADGVTIHYNRAMANIEGFAREEVLGRHLLDVYPRWTEENSTLLTVLATKRAITNREQRYLNHNGKAIKTLNNTYPIFEGEELLGAVEIAKDLTSVSDLSDRIMELTEQLHGSKKKRMKSRGIYTFDELIGKDPAYVSAVKVAKRSAQSASSVLIYGETGTGKELFAQSIHSASPRADAPFIAQNCAALPETLLEGILFGTNRGTFTGAEDRPGLFEQATGGTLFLDEINSMSEGLQAKLLRVLQENYIRRVGGQEDIPVDVRIIAAANENLKELLESGKFRKDLYYRINVIPIHLPALKDRPADIELLVDHFIRAFNEKLHKDVWMLSDDLMKAFKDYRWVGNIRELKNYIETAMNMVTDEHVITREHLPVHIEEVMLAKKAHVSQAEPIDFEGLDDYVERIERDTIRTHLAFHDQNITKTAKALRISRQSLQYKLKKYGFDRE